MLPKKAVVILGRFQPPHIGHHKIIDRAKKVFRDNGLDAIVLVIIAGKKSSLDKQRNPLTADQREKFLNLSGRCDGIRIIQAPSAFSAFEAVRGLGLEPTHVVGGVFVNAGGDVENRAAGYKKILDEYFTDEDGSPIAHHAIAVERDVESDALVDKVSGTMVRKAVESDDFNLFGQLVGLEAEAARRMYNAIKEAWSE